MNDITGTSTNIFSAVLDNNDIEDALLFSNVSTGIVEDYIHYKLPPAAKPEGEIILKNFKQNLIHCESYIQSVANIWKYKQCAGGLVNDAMAELSGLQQNYRPYSSSATRLTLFW